MSVCFSVVVVMDVSVVSSALYEVRNFLVEQNALLSSLSSVAFIAGLIGAAVIKAARRRRLRRRT
jgi:hypothetical protein